MTKEEFSKMKQELEAYVFYNITYKNSCCSFGLGLFEELMEIIEVIEIIGIKWVICTIIWPYPDLKSWLSLCNVG